MKTHHDPRQELDQVVQKVQAATRRLIEAEPKSLRESWARQDLDMLRESKRQLEVIIGMPA